MKKIQSTVRRLQAMGMAYLREQTRSWMAARPGDTPRLFYGIDRVPGRGDLAQGGAVKFQDLVSRFPNHPSGANVLYLVSSAYPPAVLTMARRARRKGVRIVVNQNGVAYPAWHGPGWERPNRVLQAVLQQADYIFYQSEFCRETSSRFLGPMSAPGEILFNCVDTSVFTPPASRPTEGPVILVAGSHMQFYRMEAAIRAFAALPVSLSAARLRIEGFFGWTSSESEARSQIEDLARSLKICHRIDVGGRYTQDQAVSMFGRAHILLHTKYNDPCPRLVIEALSCGLPVVYSASGGVPELVGYEAGQGVSVPQSWDRIYTPEPAAFASAIASVWDRYSLHSAAARRRAMERFDAQQWLMRHQDLFNALLCEPIRLDR